MVKDDLIYQAMSDTRSQDRCPDIEVSPPGVPEPTFAAECGSQASGMGGVVGRRSTPAASHDADGLMKSPQFP